MIDPNEVITIRVGELSPEPFSLTDNIPHEVGTELKRGTIEDLATFISAFIGSTDGVGFRAISVTDGQTLPTTTQQEFILVGKGTYYNVVGGSTIICTEELNAIVSNGSYWFIGVEIPVNVELAGITQFIRDGFISTTPSEDAVYDALALKANVADSEEVTNKVSVITGYDTDLYPNEKATHDALDLKLNISDLPTNLTLYPTNVASDVSGYVKMVTNIHDADYNVTAVDISTPTITTTDQLVASLITDAGVLIGQPGVFNATTFGNIRRLSGSGTATFYFKVFHRDSIGTETLIGTSSNTEVITSSSYLEFTGALLWDDGDFIDTDRIVIKYYANRIAGSSDPIYQFQFGGAIPVRTLLPVPFSVVDAGYELKANKQDDLTIDGTGTKYPTVDAVNTIDLQKVINVGGRVDKGSSSIEMLEDDGTGKHYSTISSVDGDYDTTLNVNAREINITGSSIDKNTVLSIVDGNFKIVNIKKDTTKNTLVEILSPIENTTLNFPAKTVAGTYTLATTDETVNLIGDQAITGSKSFEVPTTSNSIIFENNSSSQYANWFNLNSGGGSYYNNNSAFTSNYIANRLNGIGQFIENQSNGIASIIDSSTGSTGNLFEFKKNGTTTTYTNHLGEIITMSPTANNQVATKGYTDAKITQTITNGVTDKSPSEDAVFDALALKRDITNYVFSNDLLVNSTNVGRGSGNSLNNNVFGINALISNTTGVGVSAFSVDALRFNTTGNNNTAIGAGSMLSNISGSFNSALGYQSLYFNTTGFNNMAIGQQSMYNNTTGSNNVSVGYESSKNNTTANSNSSLGSQSMFSTTTGSSNAAFGSGSLFANTTGVENASYGANSLRNNVLGSSNSALGTRAGQFISDKVTFATRLDNSIMIGYRSSPLADNQTNQTVIGYNSTGLGSNTTVLGNSSTVQTWLGGKVTIGTTVDDGITSNKVQVDGNVKATQFRISALNTAPASATDTGTLGEVRITATYIYVCTATNTWVRTALATW